MEADLSCFPVACGIWREHQDRRGWLEYLKNQVRHFILINLDMDMGEESRGSEIA